MGVNDRLPPRHYDSDERCFARRVWDPLDVAHECALAEAAAAYYPEGIPDDPDLDVIEKLAANIDVEGVA